MSFVSSHQSLTLLLRFGSHAWLGGHSSGFSRKIVDVEFWLAEAAWMIDSTESSVCLSIMMGVSRLGQNNNIERFQWLKAQLNPRKIWNAWILTEGNQLPVSVHHSTSVSSLKSSLKTFLFLTNFSSVPLPWYTTLCVCIRVVCIEFWKYVHSKNV